MPEAMRSLAGFDPFAAAGPFADGGAPRDYVLLDVFAQRGLEGNQLAVFTDAQALGAEAMQSLALELRLSESVFLLAPEAGGDVRARIFTPTTEMPFAGHPVLGAAALVAAALDRTSVVLETGAGEVAVDVRRTGGLTLSASMSQPIPTWEPVAEPGPLLAALGIERSALPVERYCNGPSHILVATGSPAEVAALDPDLRGVQAAAGVAGVSCFAGSAGSFKTRMFAPGLGVAEDPATGSAAGPLAVHLVRHGRAAFGEQLAIDQGAELRRPSRLLARVDGGAARIDRVEVGGGVEIVGRGSLRTG
jgi:trans-2,3-dihydro-3-hydroxyanthranilate isomerase